MLVGSSIDRAALSNVGGGGGGAGVDWVGAGIDGGAVVVGAADGAGFSIAQALTATTDTIASATATPRWRNEFTPRAYGGEAARPPAG
ncbi:hypothetical protein L3i23_00910 [Herbiconiux sp. L3-i23]|nr:hypothetical protein L3i23_00910 [Herbiconiux sp. L3-i23]